MLDDARRLVGYEAGRRRDESDLSRAGHEIDVGRAAQSDGRPAANHFHAGLGGIPFQPDVPDGSLPGAHAVGEPRAFEGRPRGGGAAEKLAVVLQDDFAVGAEVHQQAGLIAIGHAGREHAGRDVRTHVGGGPGQRVDGQASQASAADTAGRRRALASALAARPAASSRPDAVARRP